jgi:hypothetical protein
MACHQRVLVHAAQAPVFHDGRRLNTHLFCVHPSMQQLNLSRRGMPRRSGRTGGVMAESGGAPATAAPTLGVERVEGVKRKLATLLTCESELDMELRELDAAWERAQKAHVTAVERMTAKREGVRAEIKAAESELDAAVNAPVSGGRDPTEWLPDELMLMVLERLPFPTVWGGACERVCQRWARLMESASIVRRKRDGRWAAYEAGTIKPRTLEGHKSTVRTVAIGLDGKVYSGSFDNTVMVWSGESGTHLQTLTGHTDRVFALAVGLDGNIYSGSFDHTVRVWSGVSGAHVRTLEGHTNWVVTLAVGLDGKIYSASRDNNIRVWAAEDGAHVQTLVGHTRGVRALAVGKDGAVYSGSSDHTIRVWSGEDGTHLRTLVGHTDSVISLAVATDFRVYSGSRDNTIRVWSPVDGSHLQTLVGHTSTVRALVVSSDGKVYSGSKDGTVRVWSSVNGALLHTMRGSVAKVCALALGRDGTLYSGGAASPASQVHLEMW